MELTPETCRIVIDALNQTSEALFITDVGGTIVYANPGFERLTGYTLQETLGKNAGILKSGEHSDEFYADMWGTIKTGREWTGRFINRRKDGTKGIDETHISPIRNVKGDLSYFLAIRRDITREAALEEQLIQNQKMEALGLLAGQLSHDFNNLLTIIIGSMELVMEEIPKESTSMKLAQGILKTSQESANLIKQLLIFSRRQEAEPSLVNLNDIITETKVLMDRLLGVNIKMEYGLAPDLVKVSMTPEQFKQVLMNLVINAKDAMPSGGVIKVRTFNQSISKGLSPSMKAGDYASVEVSDTGPGIPPEARERIFEPFFTTKPKGKGTGLGLSTVYGIIKQHKGDIVVESNPGMGAAFTIRLPKAD
ncbi:MAG: hypothetical protein A2270_03655 [Elusimicrobia bacterium RIFOXYA12_FULL_51_18]|nr:MAG: hypothetical protein A2270_03655 [Elusimicrobia bacterium RIFOXYA12_FULL_51_18]OGS31939.1 MAG: hypothetical protein A2218_06620 [Elusimicrobia bacterium RIFOXYA2_FULL_53_38]